jgi:hypothetical protein
MKGAIPKPMNTVGAERAGILGRRPVSGVGLPGGRFPVFRTVEREPRGTCPPEPAGFWFEAYAGIVPTVFSAELRHKSIHRSRLFRRRRAFRKRRCPDDLQNATLSSVNQV